MTAQPTPEKKPDDGPFDQTIYIEVDVSPDEPSSETKREPGEFDRATVLKFYAGAYSDPKRGYQQDEIIIHMFGHSLPHFWSFKSEGMDSIKKTLQTEYPQLKSFKTPYSKAKDIDWEQMAINLKLPETLHMESACQSVRRWMNNGGPELHKTPRVAGIRYVPDSKPGLSLL